MEPRFTSYPITAIVIVITIVTLWLSANRAEADTATKWERHQLHQPSPKLLQMEKRGRVTIYDGLDNSDVDRAMDEQFDRIGSMMFIHVRTNGDELDLDDGCD